MTPLHESMIQGYNITKPHTVLKNGTSRLVLLSKESLEFTVEKNLMDDIFTSIWVKITRPGVKSLLVCGAYREHQYLHQPTDWSLHPNEQCNRWSTFLRQVEAVRISSTCHIIGDLNLDYNKWSFPDHGHSRMITDTKDTLEAGGFFQLVENITRSWPGQVDSLVDHFWTNDPQKILKVSNIVRAAGDHNLIVATIRLKGSNTRKLDSRKRSYKNFDPKEFRELLENENWNDIYEINDVNLANDFFRNKNSKYT